MPIQILLNRMDTHERRVFTCFTIKYDASKWRTSYKMFQKKVGTILPKNKYST